METQEALKLGRGNTPKEVLKPKPVKVQGVRIDPKQKKDSGLEAGKIVVLICKHPDREELFELTKIKTLKMDTIKVSGIWLNLDKNGKIQMDSPVDILLGYANVNNLDELVGKELPTVVQSDKVSYLCIKAY